MSYKDWRVRVEDMLEAIERIERYIDEMAEETFIHDERTIDAVANNLEIIGEAAHAIPKSVTEKYNRLPWAVMAEMRNILIHEYHSVDPALIYRTAKGDLPPLGPQLRALLAEADEASRRRSHPGTAP